MVARELNRRCDMIWLAGGIPDTGRLAVLLHFPFGKIIPVRLMARDWSAP